MKKQIHPHIPVHLYECVVMETSRRGGMGVSAIVEAALTQYFEPEGEKQTAEQLMKQMATLSRRVETLRVENSFITEMLAQFAKNYFVFQPEVPEGQRSEMMQMGERRFNAFMERVARSVSEGNKHFEHLVQGAYLDSTEIPEELLKADDE